MRRVRNATTGVGPDADEGFAVEVGNIARQVVPGAEAISDPRLADVLHEWPSIEKYLAAPGAVRRGCFVARRSILEYFAHYSGGVHLDRAKNKPELQAAYALHEELEGRADIVGLDGLYAEIFAMGYAIGSSPDMLRLAAAIRTQAAEADRSKPNGGVFSAGFGVSVT